MQCRYVRIPTQRNSREMHLKPRERTISPRENARQEKIPENSHREAETGNLQCRTETQKEIYMAEQRNPVSSEKE